MDWIGQVTSDQAEFSQTYTPLLSEPLTACITVCAGLMVGKVKMEIGVMATLPA
ncbi:hypothetical protein [Pokkaliibacter plantistimulans]|uniref:hypothetical protein n=1 Tax=Pokkaliibacter plantistimulans TaxID=1635171 RepID=UPI00140239BF|nr:hypothetical protein [Pokkaliibacter plantistimulans]